MEAFPQLNVSLVQGPSLTAIKKAREGHCLVHFQLA